MSPSYFAVASALAREAADKVLGRPREMAKATPKEDNPDLCVICQAEVRAFEDDTCGSRCCREAYWSEFWERM